MDKKNKEKIQSEFDKNKIVKVAIKTARAPIEGKGFKVTSAFTKAQIGEDLTYVVLTKQQEIDALANKNITKEEVLFVPSYEKGCKTSDAITFSERAIFSDFNEYSSKIITLQDAIKHIKANIVHNEGITGKDVKVAIVDTGVDSDHPLMKGQVVAEKSFVWAESEDDEDGHGTWCASAVLAVAPDASIVNAKALDWAGWSDAEGLMKAMLWAADEQECDVISCSWGKGDEFSPINGLVVTQEQKHGCKFVFSAGNFGPNQESVTFPGAHPDIFCVGAIAVIHPAPDRVAEFSSRGPGPGGAIEPDISAPGGSEIEGILGASKDGDLAAKKGTSMATPLVAGAIALLVQIVRPATKTIEFLTKTARRNTPPEKDNEIGFGILDIEDAVARAIASQP